MKKVIHFKKFKIFSYYFEFIYLTKEARELERQKLVSDYLQPKGKDMIFKFQIYKDYDYDYFVTSRSKKHE